MCLSKGFDCGLNGLRRPNKIPIKPTSPSFLGGDAELRRKVGGNRRKPMASEETPRNPKKPQEKKKKKRKEKTATPEKKRGTRGVGEAKPLVLLRSLRTPTGACGGTAHGAGHGNAPGAQGDGDLRGFRFSPPSRSSYLDPKIEMIETKMYGSGEDSIHK